jgi:adenylate cyclase
LYSPQTRKRLRRGLSLLTAALILLFCVLDRSGKLDWLENRSSDWRVVATLNPAKADRDIVIIDIDNGSFPVLTQELGRFPWTRQVWTGLVRYLIPGHPKLILFDILFSGSEAGPEVDARFASAIRAAGNVILPFAFVSAESGVEEKSKTWPPDQATVSVTALPATAGLKRSEWSLNAPNPLFASAMAGSGSILNSADPDGITRRLPLIVGYDGRSWASHWLAAAMKLKGAKGAEFQNGEFRAGPIRLPVDAKGNYVVRWRGTPINAYKRIPLFEVYPCSIQPDACDPQFPRHPASEFKDKIVYIGASAAGSYEVRPTPVSETAPGMFVLATALDNLLHNDAISRTPAWLTMLLIVLLASLPAWSVMASRSITVPLAVTFGALAVYGGACFLFYSRSIWLPMSAPMLAAAVSFTGNTAYRYLTVDRELSRTRGTLERYVSPQLVRYVMDHLDSFRFDGEKRRLTVFFSDVRSFTTLTEQSEPRQLLKQLNEYLEAMTDIIFRYDGIVDKFIGDGIMAHWGAFTPDRPNALLAARAALDMMAKLAELNRHWEATGFPPLDIGIGLNTAEVIFGNVGAAKKLDFTAIGDGVNLAARLESENKVFKTHIIISESTLQELGDAAQVKPLGSVVVKGKTVGVQIYELKALADSPTVSREGNGAVLLPQAQPSRKTAP